MPHNVMIQLYRIVECNVRVENPHKKGLKKIFRDIFPVIKEQTSAIPVDIVSFKKINKFYSTPVEVSGKRYLKTSEVEAYDAGEGWFSCRPLYILEDDFNNICRGE